MIITLHQDTCMSCGLCASTAPTVFSIDTGVVTSKKDSGALTDEEKMLAKKAASECPGGAIEVTE